jgi:hypothetical protein
VRPAHDHGSQKIITWHIMQGLEMEREFSFFAVLRLPGKAPRPVLAFP